MPCPSVTIDPIDVWRVSTVTGVFLPGEAKLGVPPQAARARGTAPAPKTSANFTKRLALGSCLGTTTISFLSRRARFVATETRGVVWVYGRRGENVQAPA